MDEISKIYVYANDNNFTLVLMGVLNVDGGKGKQVLSFEFAESWLNGHYGLISFDPDLQVFKGRQYAPADKTMFGMPCVFLLQKVVLFYLMIKNWQRLLGRRSEN